jgi:hypothetical protein
VSLDWRLLMGAAIAIPLIVIVLVVVGYLLWTLYVVGLESVTVAKSTRRHGSGETAAHYDPTDHHHVSTKPPQEYEQKPTNRAE